MLATWLTLCIFVPAARLDASDALVAPGSFVVQEPPGEKQGEKQEGGAQSEEKKPESKPAQEEKKDEGKDEGKKEDGKKGDKEKDKKDKDKKEEKLRLKLSPLTDPVTWLHARRVIVRPGVELQDADVLVQGGRIVGVGKGLAAPEGARRIEGDVICAGFIDPWSALGLDENSAQDRETTPDTRSEDAVDPFHRDHLRREALRAGVTSARIQAGLRAALGGIGSIVRLVPGREARAQLVQPDACVAATVGISRGGQLDPFDRLEEVERLASAIESGRRLIEVRTEHKYELEEWQKKITEKEKELEKDFKKAKKDREKEQADAKEKEKEFKEKAYKEDKKPSAPGESPDDQVMARVSSGELPLVVEVHRANEIRALLQATKPFERLRLVLAGATEALPLARQLAERGIPVIVWPAPMGSDRPPGWAQHDLSLAARLSEAGVQVLIGSGGGSASVRDLPLLASQAIGHGLDRARAFEALTLGTAQAFDLSDRLGSVEAGKQADLLVLDGEPLSPGVRVQYVISNGMVVLDPQNR